MKKKNKKNGFSKLKTLEKKKYKPIKKNMASKNVVLSLRIPAAKFYVLEAILNMNEKKNTSKYLEEQALDVYSKIKSAAKNVVRDISVSDEIAI